jgi:hypothetical protein
MGHLTLSKSARRQISLPRDQGLRKITNFVFILNSTATGENQTHNLPVLRQTPCRATTEPPIINILIVFHDWNIKEVTGIRYCISHIENTLRTPICTILIDLKANSY